MIQGAIFDFDGTLFDSMSIWDTAGEDYLRSIGCKAKEDLQAVLKTMSLYQSACYLKEEYPIAKTIEEIMAGVNQLVEDFYFYTVLPKPSVIDLLEQLQEHGVKMCIATATDRYQVEAALNRCGMARFFREILTCTDIGHGKDEPVIFREALKILQTSRNNTLVVEDAYYAIQVAKSDGFTTAAVYDSHEPKQDEILAITDFYLPDYSELDPFWRFVSQL